MDEINGLFIGGYEAFGVKTQKALFLVNNTLLILT